MGTTPNQPNSPAYKPLPASGFSFPVADVANICRLCGPDLKDVIPFPLDPVQLMWAFANKESTHETKGFLGCAPRFEPAYYIGGIYGSTPLMKELIAQFGKDAAKSYGPWQVMLCNAARWRPEDFQHIEVCAEAFTRFLSNACRIHRPQTLDDFGQLYNGGHIVPKPGLPLAQVQEYCVHLAEWYKIPLPEAQ